MKDLIKHAYNHNKAIERFSNITKEEILNLYTSSDYLYKLLEQISVVDIYSKFEIINDFNISVRYGVVILESEHNAVQINISLLINCVTSIHVEPK